MHVRFLVPLLLLLLQVDIVAITLQQKVDINKELTSIKVALVKRDFAQAKLLAMRIKKEFPTSEFVAVANFYLARLESIQKSDYTALYYLNLSLGNEKFSLLADYERYRIIYFAGVTNYKLALFDQAKSHFEAVLNQDYFYKDSVYLYLADIYFKSDKNISKARYYLDKIKWQSLNFKEKELYSLLTNRIMWKKIETSRMGYKDPNVSCTLIDRDTIYIGLWQGGLIKYNFVLGTYRFYGANLIVSENVRALYKDKRHIYIGTTEGVSVIDKRDNSVREISALKGMSISSIEGNESTIFYGTLKESIIAYSRGDRNYSTIGGFRNITKLFYDRNRLIVTTYPRGIFVIKNGTITSLSGYGKPRSPVTDILNDGKYLWFSTYGSGIFRYDVKGRIFYRYSTLSEEIGEDYSLCLSESNGRIYCGTLGKGVFYYNSVTGQWHQLKIPDYYIGTDVKTISFSKDYMFIGTLGDGVLQHTQIDKSRL